MGKTVFPGAGCFAMPDGMPAGDEQLDDRADAVLDGVDVDWAAAESGAADDARPVVRQLRLLASVARAQSDPLPLTPEAPAFEPGVAGRDQ
jgi:hypothetical protein